MLGVEFLDLNIDIRSLVRLIVAFASFFIGLTIFIRYIGTPSMKYFAITTMLASVWVFTGAMFQVVPTLEAGYWWSYVTTPIAALIPLFFILFSVFMGSEHIKLRTWQTLLIYVPPILLFTLAAIPGFFYEQVIFNADAGVRVIDFKPQYKFIYTPAILALFIAGFPILIRKYFRAENSEFKLKLKYVLFGSAVSIVMGLLGNLILPLLGFVNLIWLGSATVIVFVLTLSYALTRRQLWDFKLLIAEIIALIITVVLVVDIFITLDPTRVVFKLVTLSIVIVFSFFLIREVSREVEERKKVELMTANLTSANRRLKEIDVERSDFVSIASHHLRTPLTVIKGYASMILEGSFGHIDVPKHKDIIAKIFEASDRLVAMIEEFLDISRIERGEMTYSFSVVNLAILAFDVISELKTSLQDNGQNILLHFKRDDDRFIIGDSLKIRQVITNILDNAIKYSPQNSIIGVYLTKENGMIKIAIRDRGMGIDGDSINKLFKKYSRTDDEAKLRTEGRGLGLYIAKQIVMAHGGKIWAESEGRGKGTAMSMEFPQISPDMKRQEIKSFVQDVA